MFHSQFICDLCPYGKKSTIRAPLSSADVACSSNVLLLGSVPGPVLKKICILCSNDGIAFLTSCVFVWLKAYVGQRWDPCVSLSLSLFLQADDPKWQLLFFKLKVFLGLHVYDRGSDTRGRIINIARAEFVWYLRSASGSAFDHTSFISSLMKGTNSDPLCCGYS